MTSSRVFTATLAPSSVRDARVARRSCGLRGADDEPPLFQAVDEVAEA
jgi:hypothetical protein